MNKINATREYETKEQRKQRIKIVFDSFDTDKNGTIELNEFIQGLSTYFNIQNLPTAETYKKFFTTMFNMCDKGGLFRRKNGKLELDEFERIADAMPLKFSRNVKVNLAHMMFNIIDKDRSGKISKRELSRFLKHCDFLKVVKNIFINDLDENGDGKIDFDEFFAWFVKFDIE